MTDSYRKDPEMISRLNPRQYAVTQESATEPAFDNEFWDKKEAGIYVDIVSGEPTVRRPSRSSTRGAAGRASPCPSTRRTWSRSRT